MAFAAARDHIDGDQLDLGELLLPHPERSMLYRVPRHQASAIQGVAPGDLLVIDRGKTPAAGELGLVQQGEELSLQRISRLRSGPSLTPDDSDTDARVCGTATLLLRPLTVG